MYVYKYTVDIYLLCMIKVRIRWCTCSLWRMNSKNTRNELARPVMGTIFLVLESKWLSTTLNLIM